MKRISTNFILIVTATLYSCSGENSKRSVGHEMDVKKVDSIIIDTLQIKKNTIDLDSFFNSFNTKLIGGIRISNPCNSKESALFNKESNAELWINHLTFNNHCNEKPYCGKAIISREEIQGQKTNEILLEISAKSNDVLSSDFLVIGNHMDSVIQYFGEPYSRNDDFLHFKDSLSLLLVQLDSKLKVSGFIIGKYSRSEMNTPSKLFAELEKALLNW